MSNLNVLVGCEESQAVCIEFRKLGYNAFSCDIKECSGGHPEWHLQMDVFKAIKLKQWDIGIFFPPCTYLTTSSNRWYKNQPLRKSGVLVGLKRRAARKMAIKFFYKLYTCEIPLVCIENPVGVLSTTFRKPDQVIQPWMFGHNETKATCLWLKGLPKLVTTDIVTGRTQRIHRMSPSKQRAMLRSKTYAGIAKAMALQWGKN